MEIRFSLRMKHLCKTKRSKTMLYQDTMQLQQEDGKCSGRCKAIVRKIVEQVRGETEQWSQMQIMLGKVREEMEELQASRNFWEDQALNSDNEIKHLQTSVSTCLFHLLHWSFLLNVVWKSCVHIFETDQ